VVEDAIGYRDQFFPVVPFADRVFALPQHVDKPLLTGVVSHLEHIAQLFDLHAIRVQVASIQSGRGRELG